MTLQALGWGLGTFIVALVALAFPSRRRRVRRRPVAPPRCGKCGYIVLGLPSLICPECGFDLSVVGLRTLRRQKRRLRRRFITWLTLWFVAAGLFGLAILSGPVLYGPELYDARFSGGVRLPDDPAQSRHWRIHVRGTFHNESPYDLTAKSNAELRFFVNTDGDEQHALHVSSANNEWSYGGDDVSRLGSVSSRRKLVETWLRARGVAPTAEEVETIVANIMETTEEIRRTGRCFHLDATGVSYSGGSATRGVSYLRLRKPLVAGALLWLAYLPWGIVRYRRQSHPGGAQDLRDAGPA